MSSGETPEGSVEPPAAHAQADAVEPGNRARLVEPAGTPVDPGEQVCDGSAADTPVSDGSVPVADHAGGAAGTETVGADAVSGADDADVVSSPTGHHAAPTGSDAAPTGYDAAPAVADGPTEEFGALTAPAAELVAPLGFPSTGADTATADSFAFTFNLAKIENQGEDADPLLHRARDLGIVGVFDGMGGAGGRVYETADGPRTGAYLASRIVRDVVGRELLGQFSIGGDVDGAAIADALHGAAETALVGALADLHAPQSGLRSRLIRALPTTMAAAVVRRRDEDEQTWDCHVFWAGDSRIYVLDPVRGVAQLTTDDIRDRADAMANLRADSVLSNAMSADTPFAVHHRRLELPVPFLLIAATDGAFGYLPSPMHFEHLLLSSLRTTSAVQEWSVALQQQVAAVTGDDAAMAVLGVGASYPVFRDLSAARGHQLENDVVRPLDGVSGDLQRAELEVEILRTMSAELSADMWNSYRAGYDRYGTGPGEEGRS